MKWAFDLSQAQLVWIGTVGTLTFPLSPLSGWLTDKKGPRVSVMLGGVIVFLGLVLQYLIATRKPVQSASGATALLCLSACVVSVGANLVASQAYASPLRAFPDKRGVVMGLVKAYAGIAGGLMTQCYIGFIGFNIKRI